MNSCDQLIIGSGIVGLAVAREIRKRSPHSKILILEKEKGPGLHASGRNSGVLHSGIYYPPGSLKAQVCKEGARQMTVFAEERKIPLRKGGKVILATKEEEIPRLHALMENARANQIRAELCDETQIRKIEPHARAYRQGIHLPDVAVIDPLAVVHALVKELKEGGVEIHFTEPVESVDPSKREVKTPGGRYGYGHLFNCAGAYADRIARFFGLASRFALIPFKGTYCNLRLGRESLVHSNIYPVPDPMVPFLGIHFTRSVEGSVHVGPTAIPALGRENYGILEGLAPSEMPAILGTLSKMFFASGKFRRLAFQEWANYWKPHFVAEARKLIPELEADDLVPSSKVGIRPQLVDLKTKTLVMDYVIEKTSDSTHVLNAVSPAFTSAFSFAEVLVNGRV